MKIDITSMFFNSSIEGQTATAAWATSIGQKESNNCRIDSDKPGVTDFVIGMTYKIQTNQSLFSHEGSTNRDLMMFSVFDKVFVNGIRLTDTIYTIALFKENTLSHPGRLMVCYAPHLKFNSISNSVAIEKMRESLNCTQQGCWFVYEISIVNQDELHFTAMVLNNTKPKIYHCKSKDRSKEWKELVSLKEEPNNEKAFDYYMHEIAVSNSTNSPFEDKTIKEYQRALKYIAEDVNNAYPQYPNIYYVNKIDIVNNIKELPGVIARNMIGRFQYAALEQYKHFLNWFGEKEDLFSEIKKSEQFPIDKIITAIKSTGLFYSDYLIKRFTYSIMSKPFVILSGLSGSGKTQLALTFAKTLCEDFERQLCIVSVGADWTNREPLLGYPNALKDSEYVKPESGVLDLLLNASKDPIRPYFLILDEMNLSVVERYFADFLSSIESHEPIKLWDVKDNDYYSITRVPHEIGFPSNVFVIGTINVDETTYMFSPKVLDRANVIEFKISKSEMKEYLAENHDIDLNLANHLCSSIATDFLLHSKDSNKKFDNTNLSETLSNFFNKLSSINTEFGYRTVNEIYCYVNNAINDLGETISIDTAILQKLLPKLHGSRKQMIPVLSSLWELCFTETSNIPAIDTIDSFEEIPIAPLYKFTAEKVYRMYHYALDNGFTSFAEA